MVEKFQIPVWSQYKIDGIPQLEKTQRKLAAKGLKDPWLRNEVWRYHNHKSVLVNMGKSFWRGMPWAIAAMALTIAADQVFDLKIGQIPHVEHCDDQH